MELEGDDYANCDWCFWHSNYRIIKGPGWLGSWRTSGDHPNDSIIENGQNTEKSPVELRSLAVTQIPVKNHLLTLMWKTLKGNNNSNHDHHDNYNHHHLNNNHHHNDNHRHKNYYQNNHHHHNNNNHRHNKYNNHHHPQWKEPKRL